MNIADAQWAALPLDEGTRRVLADGAVALHDPDRLLARALVEMTGATVRGAGGAAPR